MLRCSRAVSVARADYWHKGRFGLMDIFNHLIMSKTDYDKSVLSSWRSFEEYNLCLKGHVQSLGFKSVQDLDGSSFFVFVAGVIPTQKKKNPRRREALQALVCP